MGAGSTVKREPLGIIKVEALHYYVRDLERTRRFFVDNLDFAELGHSSPDLDREGRQHAAAFAAGDAVFVIHQPLGEGGRAWRYLRKHPEGVGTLVFEVEDIDRAFALLDQRGGTFITDILRFSDDGGKLAMFSITTPFGDTTFRFIERKGYRALFPGMIASSKSQVTGGNRFGFTHIDHVTSNFQTMKPALLWMEHVLGFEPFWEIAFHTNDVAGAPTAGAAQPHGSGLKSVVMWDPHSGIKFANNEPFRPFFKDSQINIFAEDNRGDGVQHSALAVRDIIGTVRGLKERGVEFMSTPGTYFDMLPERLRRIGVGAIDEAVETLRQLEILVDGERPHQYLLQIFLKEAAGLYHDPAAGPFFFEIIQRKGDQGFGAGNFRALFEAIERDQTASRVM
ncbi:MAG TPA: VOC family protein [Polyangia bacterium]|jgi:4-hydroxyphenylpyruvate dioxygenase|nr:VOC family protein [Polyangia bacterium]